MTGSWMVSRVAGMRLAAAPVSPGARLTRNELSAAFMCRSSESSGDVIVGLAALGRREDLRGRTDLDELSEVHEPGYVGHPRGLLQVMGDYHDTVLFAQRLQGLLDLQRRDGVERGGGLVEQQHFRLHGDGPGDAKPLLLSARQAAAVGVQLVLDFVPYSRIPKGRFDPHLDVRTAHAAGKPQTECHVLEYGHR